MTTEKTVINGHTGRPLQLWVTVDQYAFIKSFNEFKDKSNSDILRFILRDFFEARGEPYPADPLPHGDWKREHASRGKR